nr:hypothetical protein [Streptomyces pseudovenezuelae]
MAAQYADGSVRYYAVPPLFVAPRPTASPPCCALRSRSWQDPCWCRSRAHGSGVATAIEALSGSAGERADDGERLTAHAFLPPAAEPALAHLHGLERALAELATPLRMPSGSPLVGA